MRSLVRLLTLLAFIATVAPAFAQKAYVREDLAGDGVRLEEQIRKDAAALSGPLAARPLADARRDAESALQRKDFAAARTLLTRALAAAPREGQAWLDWARATRLLAIAKPDESWRLNQSALAAAYLAYQRVATPRDEALALGLLGAVYNDLRQYRLALNAWRAGLDAFDTPTQRAAYERLRAERGFRVVDYKVDSDAASPRVCVQFSEPLARGKVDFAPYIAVSGAANAAISSEDQQLCVEGLLHGEKYSIVVRQGLPSSVGETLLKSADYEVYVRDRSPQVRFTGRNYVLPRVGQEGVPLVSVNTDKVAASILRIGDRNLLPTLRSDDFLAQLSAYRARNLINEQGVRIWSGSLDVRREINKDVVTAFPVTEAVGRMEPGVYVMVARAGERPLEGDQQQDDSDSYESIATQWFVVSDLGLTAFSGADGVHGFVRSLATAEPVAGVQLRLIARNNEVLATLPTDGAGHVRFDPGLSRGTGGMAPNLIAAMKDDDYGFLDLAQAPFDLTDRGVKGRVAARALDAFVYPERGVYRSGETVNLSALLRDGAVAAMASMPLTLVVKRPDGVEYRRERVADQGLGGRAWSFPLLSGSATGAWRVQAFMDPRSPAIGEASFLVEDYVPERLDLTLKAQEPVLLQGATARVDVEARYLYGAPGAGLEVSGELVIGLARGVAAPGLAGYVAGLEDESFETVRTQIEEAVTTDAQGRATVEIAIPQVDAPRPVEAKFVLRAGEPGGRAIERTLTLPIRPSGGLIAVKKNFEDLSDGASATFDVVALSPEGARIAAKSLQYTLYRVSNDYQWYNSGGRWGFERVKSSRKIAEGRIDVTAGETGKIAVPVGWGAHRLDLASDGGALGPTSVKFNVGWSGDVTADTPDLLDVTLDKAGYAPGDTMTLRIASRFSGKATVAIVSDRVHDTRLVDVAAGETQVSIPVQAGWGAGAYAVAFAHRPLDTQARRMPGRALGLAWFEVDREARRLTVDLGLPERMQPRQPLSIPVRLGGLAPGEEAYVTLAAVDVGILSLTRHEAPDASAYFFGQRQLGLEIRDLYGLLIDGMQGARGAIRSGGDAGAGAPEGNRPTQEPLARYSGVVKVGPDGLANITFEIPAFNGAVRVMAVAWTKSRVGEAWRDVIVRDPVVVQATLPRFLSLGDRSRFHIQVDNVEGPSGEFVIDVDVRGPVSITADALRRTVRLAQGARTQFSIPVAVAGFGRAEVDLRITGPGVDARQTLAVGVQPGSGELYRRVVRQVAPGESLLVSSDLLADFVPRSGAVSVSASRWGGIDAPALLQALDRYPYGCTEQTVSRAMPLLYVNRLASQAMQALDEGVEQRVNDSIARVLSRQDSTGAFGLWSANGAGQDLWLDAFVGDFLTRAREAGYAVPQRAFDQAVDRLRNQVANAGEISPEQGSAIAYALYVLARNGRPIMSDLRYLADTKLAVFETGLAKAQVGAALALLGDKARSQAVFMAAGNALRESRPSRLSRADYGSRLRDGAGLLALAAEANADRALLQLAGAVVQQERAASAYASTQEMNWMVLAAQALSKEAAGMALSVDGEPHAGAYDRTWGAASLDSRAATIVNTGAAPAQIVLTTSGQPIMPEAAASQGYQVERAYYALDGKPMDMGAVRQNQRFVVVLKVTESEAAYARLLLVDRLPAGLEIDNPKLFEGGSVDALAFAKPTVEPVHSEYRDDRFAAAFERSGAEKAIFHIAYIVRAVTPGRYVHPPATVEDMYRPQRFGRTGYGALDVSEAR